MARAWLEERLNALLPALQALDALQEAEIARLCEEELAAWRARPEITRPQSLRPILTAARKAIKQGIQLTAANRWRNPRTGQWEHLALKHLNFTAEEWAALNALSEAKLEERQRNQQLLEKPQVLVARAEQLLRSDRWDDLVTGLAVVSGRRLTELLKTGRFFPHTASTVIFDGQLKRRDLDLKPYEIPVLVPAEVVLSAWRKLRALEDGTKLDLDQV
jgi:telomere resolvase